MKEKLSQDEKENIKDLYGNFESYLDVIKDLIESMHKEGDTILASDDVNEYALVNSLNYIDTAYKFIASGLKMAEIYKDKWESILNKKE